MTHKSDLSRLSEMVNGFQQTCVLVAALQVGLVDRLQAGGGSAPALAAHLQLQPLALTRLLRVLRELGLVSQQGETWQLTSAGQLLGQQGLGAGLRAWAELVGGEYLASWGRLSHSLKTGEPAFPQVFAMTAWEHRQQTPDLNQSFQRLTGGEQARALTALLRSYDFSIYHTVVDVGGGEGRLLTGLLQKFPHLSGILFDLPHVVAGATLGERCQAVGGSFLEGVPTGGDLYLLKHVLHNWDDATCLTVLGHCRQAMGPKGTLLVLEHILPEEDGQADLPLLMLDLHMLAVLGGRERSESEYRELLAAAGLYLEQRWSTRAGAPEILQVRSKS